MKEAATLFLAVLSVGYADPKIEMPAFVSDSDSYSLSLVIPKEKKTKIFTIENDTFKLAHTFDWVAEEVFIQDTYEDISVVKVTPQFRKEE